MIRVMVRQRTAEEIRRTGFEALVEALGSAGALRFVQQLEGGRGDYTRDRHQWLGDSTVDEIVARIKRRRESDQSSGDDCVPHSGDWQKGAPSE